jgi:phosphoribosylglycinamide formyltransferase 1
MIRIAVFASGTGSNAINLYQYFLGRQDKQVVALYTDNPSAPVLDYFSDKPVIRRILNRHRKAEGGDALLALLQEDGIDIIALAGFLSMVPAKVVEAYPHKMVNIHPSLLPKYGGKGMYGDRVHEAVLAQGEQETGITVHFVNEQYDEGDILAQRKFPIAPQETLQTLKSKISIAEQELYPRVLDLMV